MTHEKPALTRLASTTEPGPAFGRFNLPMSTRELVFQLANDVPCQIPRAWLPTAMQTCDVAFVSAEIKVEADRKIAQLTPVRCALSDRGRALLAN